MENHPFRVAVVGAGWAGCTAALMLARAGIHVTVYEAGKVPGGRARVVEKEERLFDNGQHILLGAYHSAIRLIESLHPQDRVFHRRSLALHSAPNAQQPLQMQAPTLPAPFHLLMALLRAKGLSRKDKWHSIVWAQRHLNGHTKVPTGLSVCELLASQPARARELLWEPLCIAALNTPPHEASAQVFLTVLRAAFAGSSKDSDLVIPSVDLSNLLPIPALAEVKRRGGDVHLGTAVNAVEMSNNVQTVTIETRKGRHDYDHVIVATGPQHVSRLIEHALAPGLQAVLSALSTLPYEAITTLHFEGPHAQGASDGDMRLLNSQPGQWLFWHQQSSGDWRASVVISAHHKNSEAEQLTADTLRQVQQAYPDFTPTWSQIVTEKRATYACTPAVFEQLSQLSRQHRRIHFAGDWCYPLFPATLEAAVRSGENTAQQLIQLHSQTHSS